MPRLAPQEIRTFFISTVAWGRRSIFQTDRMASLLIDVMRDNAAKNRMAIHEFVVMRDHLHVILTPAPDQSIEKCVQFIKGGFSFRAKKELQFSGDVWQESFKEHRIADGRDYVQHREYVISNPVRARYVSAPEEWRWSSVHRQEWLAPRPEHLQGLSPDAPVASSLA
jgi:putative transposase